jgi:hypothetical protein
MARRRRQRSRDLRVAVLSAVSARCGLSTMDPVRKQVHCRNFLQCKQELAPNAEAGMPTLPLRKFTARRHATTSRAAPRTTRERRALPRLQVHRPIFPKHQGSCNGATAAAPPARSRALRSLTALLAAFGSAREGGRCVVAPACLLGVGDHRSFAQRGRAPLPDRGLGGLRERCDCMARDAARGARYSVAAGVWRAAPSGLPLAGARPASWRGQRPQRNPLSACAGAGLGAALQRGWRRCQNGT